MNRGFKKHFSRLLSPIVEIEEDEIPRVAAAALAIFLLMTSYYIVKSIRSSKFLDDFGSYYLLYTYYANAILTLATVMLYNKLVELCQRKRLIDSVYLCVGSVFTGIWLLDALGFYPKLLTVAIYFVVCVYILVLTSLLWSLIHDMFESNEAKRLYALILLSAQGGVFAGGKLTKHFINVRGYSTMELIPISLIFLLATYISVCYLESFKAKKKTSPPKKSTGSLGDLSNLLKSPYARLIALLVIFSTFGVTLVDWQMNKLIETELSSADAKTAFIGGWYSNMSIMNIVFLLLAGRIIASFGPGFALSWLPLSVILASIARISDCSLSTMAFFWILSQSMNYTFYNAGKENLYVPTERDFRYKFKAIIDAAGYRFGDASGATATLLYIHFISATWTAGAALITFLVGIVWLPTIYFTQKRYKIAVASREG